MFGVYPNANAVLGQAVVRQVHGCVGPARGRSEPMGMGLRYKLNEGSDQQAPPGEANYGFFSSPGRMPLSQ